MQGVEGGYPFLLILADHGWFGLPQLALSPSSLLPSRNSYVNATLNIILTVNNPQHWVLHSVLHFSTTSNTHEDQLLKHTLLTHMKTGSWSTHFLCKMDNRKFPIVLGE
jgi:hypothetical protein